METLRGGSLSTDWSIFHKLDLNEATHSLIDYTNFCVDDVAPKKNILHFPNNKEVKACINEKETGF